MMPSESIAQPDKEVTDRIGYHTYPFNKFSVLPTGLPDTGDFTLQAQQPEADAAHFETPQISVHASAQAAAMVAAGFKFRRRSSLVSQRQSGHGSLLFVL
jgi:hypothetical protein